MSKMLHLNADLLMLDANEAAIRQRQREAEENKRRILEAYDAAARAGCGPKTVFIPELIAPEGTERPPR